MPDNAEKSFEIIYQQHAVGVVALTADKKVLVVEQYRPGPEKILLEIPGGIMNDNESPLDAIKRELLEETGYTGDFQFLGTNIDDAYSNKIRYNYIGINCHKVQEQNMDENEFGSVILLTIEEFKKVALSGELTDMENALLALHYLHML